MSTPTENTLPTHGILEALTDSERSNLARFGTFKDYKAGEVIIQQDKAQDALYLVISGTLHAYIGADQHQVLLGRIAEGEWFGEINIFDPSTATATVIAKSPAKAWFISRTQIEDYLNGYPAEGCVVLLSISQMLCKRVRRMDQRLEAAVIL